ncbi:MAG: hypothetical protein ACI90V_011778, partial [Bacillariaceae sp.]
SESNLRFDIRSLDEDEIFDPPTSRSRSKKPLLEAALKAKSKSESNLNFDIRSLDEDEIFDPPTSRSRSKKPLLEAAIKAKSESNLRYVHSNSEISDSWKSDESRDDKSNVVPEHLLSLSQPRLYHPSDIHSIDDDDLFESLPEDPPPDRPLLRAALQAKAQQEEGLFSASINDVPNQSVNGHHTEIVPEHLVMVNQPAIVHVHDAYSIEPEEIFDASTEQPTCTSKPLLTAALKAKAQQEQRLTKSFSYFETKFVDTELSMTYEELSKSVPDHLSNLHQPINLSSHAQDEYSIESEEIFDASTEQPTCTSKPLLAAALKAKAEQEQRLTKSFSHCETKLVQTDLSTVNEENDFSKSVPDHLTLLHQPMKLSSHVHDELSIDDDNFFDPPRPAVEKPLLAAALLAKKTNEEFPAMKNQIKLVEGEGVFGVGDYEDDKEEDDNEESDEDGESAEVNQLLLESSLRAKTDMENSANSNENDFTKKSIENEDSEVDELEEVHRRLLAESNEEKNGHRKMNLAKENNEEEESSEDEDSDSYEDDDSDDDSDDVSDDDSDDDSDEGGDGVKYEKVESYVSDNEDEDYSDSSYEGVDDDEDSDENDSDDIKSPEDSL